MKHPKVGDTVEGVDAAGRSFSEEVIWAGAFSVVTNKNKFTPLNLIKKVISGEESKKQSKQGMGDRHRDNGRSSARSGRVRDSGSAGRKRKSKR